MTIIPPLPARTTDETSAQYLARLRAHNRQLRRILREVKKPNGNAAFRAVVQGAVAGWRGDV